MKFKSVFISIVVLAAAVTSSLLSWKLYTPNLLASDDESRLRRRVQVIHNALNNLKEAERLENLTDSGLRAKIEAAKQAKPGLVWQEEIKQIKLLDNNLALVRVDYELIHQNSDKPESGTSSFVFARQSNGDWQLTDTDLAESLSGASGASKPQVGVYQPIREWLIILASAGLLVAGWRTLSSSDYSLNKTK